MRRACPERSFLLQEICKKLYFVEMMHDSIVLMGDVTGSSARPAREVQAWLSETVGAFNQAHAQILRSPLTVTLGDEFQGVVSSLSGAVAIIVNLELASLTSPAEIELHYVLLEGRIDTPTNPDIAHGMLGPGLTRARQLLSRKPTQKRPRRKFVFRPADLQLGEIGQGLFDVMEGLERRWSGPDRHIAAALLEEEDDTMAAARLGRDRSSVYRRRRTMLIEEYRAARTSLLALMRREEDRSDG